MIRIIVILTIAVSLLSCKNKNAVDNGNNNPIGEELTFETLSIREFSHYYTERENVIVKSNILYDTLWRRIYSDTTLPQDIPEIDFSKHMVITVFLGTKPDYAYKIEIKKIIMVSDTIKVYSDLQYPGSNCPFFPTVTSAWHMIKTNNINKPIIFLDTNVAKECIISN